MVIEDKKFPGEGEIGKSGNLQEVAQGIGNVLYRAGCVVYMGKWINQSSSNCELKICAFH